MYPSVHLYTYVSIELGIYLSLCLTTSSYPSTYMSDYLFLYLCLQLSSGLSIYLGSHMSIYLCLSLYFPIYLSIHLSTCLSISLLIYLTIYLTIDPPFSLFIFLPVRRTGCVLQRSNHNSPQPFTACTQDVTHRMLYSGGPCDLVLSLQQLKATACVPATHQSLQEAPLCWADVGLYPRVR